MKKDLDLYCNATTQEDLKNYTTKEPQALYLEHFNIEAPIGLAKPFLIKDILQKRIDKLVDEYSKVKTVNLNKVKQFEVTNRYKIYMGV